MGRQAVVRAGAPQHLVHLRAPVKTTLTFDIIPDDVEDDIDFLLFAGNIRASAKDRGRDGDAHPGNISRNDPAIGSRCGLSKDAPTSHVRSGVGASFSKAVEVEQGDLFYLVMIIRTAPMGTIHFHYDPRPSAGGGRRPSRSW